MATITTDETTTEPLKHPGFLWLDDASCLNLADAAEAEGESPLAPFFVEAGHVIAEETKEVCRACPVRRECLMHAYLGGPGGTMIAGGYLGAMSLGTRKKMTLEEALEWAENDKPTTTKRS